MSDEIKHEDGAEVFDRCRVDPDLPELLTPLGELKVASGFDVQEFVSLAEAQVKEVAAD